MIKKFIIFLNKNEYIVKRYWIFFNRFFIIRRLLYTHIKSFKKYINWNVMDFWCWYKPYKKIFSNVTKYYWIDYISTKKLYNSADYYYDWNKIPFGNDFFDSLICSEVLEHVFNIDEVLKEIHRVLKKWAYWIITIPFARDEHEVPHDFWRYTYFWIKHILKKNNFTIVRHIKSWNYIAALSQLFIMYYIKVTSTNYDIINIINRLFIISSLNVIWLLLIFILPNNDDFYLNNIILIRK